MTFRIAVVQPIANPIEQDSKNVADAEGRMPSTFDPSPAMADLARLSEMRTTTDGVTSAKGYGAEQGVLGPQWQRPELREAIYSRPRHDAAE